MAQLVGAFASSHAPLIARDWDILPTEAKQKISSGFREMRSRIEELCPDLLIMLAPDHWVNFFLDNLPAFCIGLGPEHGGPPEPFLSPKFPYKKLKGHPEFSRHLADTAFEIGFDPSLSYNVNLDHGFCIPLWQLGLDPLPKVIPIFVNELEQPMPSIKRCFDWGRMIRSAIVNYPEDLKVAVIGSGGLSHSIGEPTMGKIDERFDKDCIDLFSKANEAEIIEKLIKNLPNAGNGSEEIRSWIIAHAVMNGEGFELIDYAPILEVYVGCCWAEWKVA